MSNPFREAKTHLYLRGVRQREELGRDESLFICDALLIARRLGKITDEQFREAKTKVMTLLEGKGTLSVWLREHDTHAAQHLSMMRLASIQARNKLQVTRHAWIDWLADQWDKRVRS